MDDTKIRTVALYAALETDFHGDLNNLLKAANEIQAFLLGDEEIEYIDLTS